MIPVPAFMTPRLVAGAALCAALVLSGWMARGKWDAAALKDIKLEQANKVAKAEKTAREELEKAREREAALMDATKGIVDEARQITQALERSVGASDAVSRSMLDAAARAAKRCPASAAAAPARGSPGPVMPGGMSDGDRFLRVLGELDGAAGAYAADSGRARAARAACQSAYEAAMKAVNQP